MYALSAGAAFFYQCLSPSAENNATAHHIQSCVHHARLMDTVPTEIRRFHSYI